MSDHRRLDGIYELEGSAVWWEGDLIIYGNWSSVGLFVHEVSHTLDYFVSGNEEVPLSGGFDHGWREITFADNGCRNPGV